MQTQVQKSESIRMGNGILKVGGVNIGALKGGELETEFATSQVKFANAKLPPRQKVTGVKFKATLVELYLDNLNNIYGGDLSTLDSASNTDTGNDRKILTFDDFIRVIQTQEVVFENTDANGKKFGIRIFEGYASNGLGFGFPDDDDLESVSELPVEFSGYPDQNDKWFEVFDEVAVS